MQLFPHLNLCQGKALWALGLGVRGNVTPDCNLVQVVVLGPFHFKLEKNQLLLQAITPGLGLQPIDPIYWGAPVKPTEQKKVMNRLTFFEIFVVFLISIRIPEEPEPSQCFSALSPGIGIDHTSHSFQIFVLQWVIYVLD